MFFFLNSDDKALQGSLNYFWLIKKPKKLLFLGLDKLTNLFSKTDVSGRHKAPFNLNARKKARNQVSLVQSIYLHPIKKQSGRLYLHFQTQQYGSRFVKLISKALHNC